VTGWLERLTGLELQDAWLLGLLLLVPLGLFVRHRRGSAALLFPPAPFLGSGPLPDAADGAPRASAPPVRSPRLRLRRWLVVVDVAALALLAWALARPVERVALPRHLSGIDVVLCLDVSSSMAADDLAPGRTRLDVVKDAAARFIDARASDRIGLVHFARFPDVVCPPTLDHQALAGFLGALRRVEADGPEDLTGIGTAVARTAQVLRSSTAKSKVVVLLTDGEENVATEQAPDEIGPARAAKLCQELGVRVYTIAAGIGKRRADGQWAELDTSAVRALAESTGGGFFEARDAGAIDLVFSTIDGLEKVEFEEPRYELRDRFVPILLVALALLVAARLARSTALEVLP
jgi:Ca-activated chloride channel family protein